MPSLPVVKHLDVIEQALPSFVEGTVLKRKGDRFIFPNVRNYNDPISDDQARRFILNGQVSKTWGEAVEFRVKKQSQMPVNGKGDRFIFRLVKGPLNKSVPFLIAAFHAVGDLAEGKWADVKWEDGSPEKIALHAVVGGLLNEATGGDFATGALAAGVNEALIERLSGVIEGDKSLELAVSQLIGVAAATVTGGDPAKAAELAKNATAYNRQLHPDEKRLARELARKSNGLYTVEQIEEQLRLSSIKGTSIGPGTDMAAAESGIYDPDGKWRPLGNGYYMQEFGDLDRNVIAFIKQNTDVYSWAAYEVAGPRYDWAVATSAAPRDRMTGYALDNRGDGYRVPVVVDGVAHSPRFFSCGNAECVSAGANIDFSDAETIAWIKAANVDAINKTSKALAAGSLFSTGGASGLLGTGSTTAGLLSGYLKEDLSGALSAAALSLGFKRFAVASGVPAVAADKMAATLDIADVWSNIVEGVRK